MSPASVSILVWHSCGQLVEAVGPAGGHDDVRPRGVQHPGEPCPRPAEAPVTSATRPSSRHWRRPALGAAGSVLLIAPPRGAWMVVVGRTDVVQAVERRGQVVTGAGEAAAGATSNLTLSATPALAARLRAISIDWSW